jgi:hypothetical protein
LAADVPSVDDRPGPQLDHRPEDRVPPILGRLQVNPPTGGELRRADEPAARGQKVDGGRRRAGDVVDGVTLEQQESRVAIRALVPPQVPGVRRSPPSWAIPVRKGGGQELAEAGGVAVVQGSEISVGELLQRVWACLFGRLLARAP